MKAICLPEILIVTSLLPGPTGAETHEFKPQDYKLTFSSTEKPALRIRPGDTVVTTSVDSEGGDENGKIIGPKYNSLTGPFYIEGAKRGDTLVIHLEKVRLNSKGGLASTRMSDAAITAREFVMGHAGSKLYHWVYDHEAGTATTDVTPRLAKLRMRLRPFTGCIGVAPAHGEALSSLYAGAHGGNIDYNQIVEGTTVYLPVNVDGAYFYFGDGHAFQGDGEPNGGAVETPLAVTFRAELHANKTIPSLRADNKEWYIALGVGNPIDTAFQRATANMVHWLMTEFGLDRHEAYVLIGTSARFDIGSIVNERGNSVGCRIRKELLRQMLGR
jgi:acetamidase/formamidase